MSDPIFDIGVDRTLAVAVPIAAVGLGLITVAYIATQRVISRSTGPEKQTKIAINIEEGAKAFLKREYFYLSLFVIVMMLIVGAVQTTGDEDGKHHLHSYKSTFSRPPQMRLRPSPIGWGISIFDPLPKRDPNF